MALRRLQTGNRGIVIAAPWSGSGKTIITCALIRLLKKQGLKVAPFKIGPDYIDPAYLTKAAGRPCYNLDAWMCPGEALHQSFRRGMREADFAIVEGVMGLFDGLGGTTKASTAEVAKELGLPVVLVLPAKSFSGTAAALVRGLIEFDENLKFLGLILNQVGSAKHERFLRRALSEVEIPVIGVIPRDEILGLPSRHLGLVQAEELDFGERLEKLAEKMVDFIDIEVILNIRSHTLEPEEGFHGDHPFKKRFCMAVARDKAFAFYYRENLDLLMEAGADLIYFSPLKDPFPEKAQALYIGGGYPELFAESLSQRKELLEYLRKRIKEGLPVLAECGGFMFLLEAIETQGKVYPMVGAIKGVARMTKGLRALGYREVRFTRPNFLFPEKALARGHEFRYSVVPNGKLWGLEVKDAEGQRVETYGLAENNLVASYIHFHFGSCPEALKHFVSQI